MDDWVLRMPWPDGLNDLPDSLVTREWLVTNGLGGYASGTIAGVVTRRYHGLLVAALPTPLGRQLMLNHLSELVHLPDGATAPLCGAERGGGLLDLPTAAYLTEFRLDLGQPVWRYDIHGSLLEKRVFMVHAHNTVHIQYCLLAGGGPVRLDLRPWVHFRAHHAALEGPNVAPYPVTAAGQRLEIVAGFGRPPLHLYFYGERPAVILESASRPNVLYRAEESRGYDYRGSLWSPGYFRADLDRDKSATLTASSESWETMLALNPDEARKSERARHERLLAMALPTVRTGPASELVLAADRFIIIPCDRVEDAEHVKAAGAEVRTLIAGYHWFTDWGRDTMISLEGLALVTGRVNEAGSILRTCAHYIRDGLIPNLFPEGQKEGLYHTADATLWFFHAVDRYLAATNDRQTLLLLLPKLSDIVAHYLRGTKFGISVDARDGLLRQGQEGYQLTWMDAKVDGWVVTPRRGKAVEINALWYNALRLLESWVRAEQGEAEAAALGEHAERARLSFNERFWYAKEGYLYDVVDGENGDDPACRPNQVLAISLPHPILDQARWEPVLSTVQKRLLTPVGLRSLARGHPDYKPKYDGDLRARDAAYHQGTVWAWLIGPFIDAWLKLHPDDRVGARRFLDGFVGHLNEACIGSISEIFDAEEPFTPRGCIAQAWSVAEVLRCFAKTADITGVSNQQVP
jgi:predicted glycogen debranching enzyme